MSLTINTYAVPLYSSYPPALSMVGSGKVDPKPMITHRFPLSQLLEAIELVGSRSEGVVKVMIQC